MLVGDPVLIVVSREEVEARDTSSIMRILRSCLVSTERMLGFFERIDVLFHGYDDDTRELCEIDAVREYVSLLDSEFPYTNKGVPPALPGRQQKFDISGGRLPRSIDETPNREPPRTR